ncbi:TQO small subunit DoxD [Polycladidibacter hongkongensis]|uniref:TQO small subunit DoxD n=1 Tax=Polycladidibacter hongkongensis TaxID=1647556 RepID=UPI00082BD579|nr:TQO small subunit DoxD [Pseudovibrio hongkongensis]
MVTDTRDNGEDLVDKTQRIAIGAATISMGFVFLMGAWRRFYNMPNKLDVDSPAHLSNKLVGAAPGSPIEGIIHWVLYHPELASFSVYAMSAAEAIVGLGLILGFLTRLAAFGAALINVALMLIFGWQGYECLDEWTMAALGFAISISALLSRPVPYSIDNALGRDPGASVFSAGSARFLVVLSVALTVGFYSYFFGIFDFHKRTSTHVYSIVAEKVAGAPERATLYVDAGGSSTAAYVRSITFTLEDGREMFLPAAKIEVTKVHFKPWSKSGKIVDGVLKLRLGSKVDIKVPADAVSAKIDLIDNKDPVVQLK